MKAAIYNQYLDRITRLYRVSVKELFAKTKQRDIVEGRYLLYYLCNKRGISIADIQRYLKEDKFAVKHTTIMYGIRVIEERAAEDKDYIDIIKNIQKSVSI